MMVMTTAANRLRQIRDVGELPARRGVAEIRRELRELGGRRRIAVRCRGLSGALQVRGDLLGDLFVLGRVGFLELLQRAQHLCERRELAAVGLRLRCPADAARTGFGREAGALKHRTEYRLKIIARKAADGTHAGLIGSFAAVFKIS